MKQHQPVQEATEPLPIPRRGEKEKGTQPETAGVSWQFRALIAVIAFGFLMMLGKAFGLF